jgi:hypothetical protein
MLLFDRNLKKQASKAESPDLANWLLGQAMQADSEASFLGTKELALIPELLNLFF